MTTADELVNEALFGTPEIKHEPQNYFLHRDTFLRTVQRAMEAEREACAKAAEEYGLRVNFTPTNDKEAPFLLGKVGAACDIAQLIRERGK
jgi:hypothetical protein